MLQYIKLPLFKKTRHAVIPKPLKRPRIYKNKYLPFEIQEIICNMLLEDDETNENALNCIQVCRSWANIICQKLYRSFQFKNYLQFIGFVNSIASKHTILPYGLYVKYIDLSPVNKYGVDSRVRRLIKYCPNMIELKLGQITSVKAETLQLMGKYCHNIHTLEMGTIQSFPFMFECDFSGMIQLKSVQFLTTPLQSCSLQTLPNTIQHVTLSQLDAFKYNEFIEFLQHHQAIHTLSIRRCKFLNTNLKIILRLLPNLHTLELHGTDITDHSLRGVFDTCAHLKSLKLSCTQITTNTLKCINQGSISIDYLDISNNPNIPHHYPFNNDHIKFIVY